MSAYGLNIILLPAGSRWPAITTSAVALRGSIHTGLYRRSVSVTTARVKVKLASAS